MEKEFIPYQQALELKELDYDKPCLASWNFYTRELNYNGQPSIFSSEDVIQLPTFSQAFRWFREKYNIISSTRTHFNEEFFYEIYVDAMNEITSDYYNTYEEAELACLIKMIEIKKKYI